MLEAIRRAWKSWLYSVGWVTPRLFIWQSGKNRPPYPGNNVYRVVAYYSLVGQGVTLKEGKKWRTATIISTTMNDLDHIKTVGYHYWSQQASQAYIDGYDILVTVRMVSPETHEVIPEISPIYWWGSDVPGDPRKLPRPVWNKRR